MLIENLIGHGRPAIELVRQHRNVDAEVRDRHARCKAAVERAGNQQSCGKIALFGDVLDMITGRPEVTASLSGKHKPP